MSSEKDVSQEWSKVKPAPPPPPPSDSTYQPSTAPSTFLPPSTVSSTTSSEHAVRAIREGLGWLPAEKLDQMDTQKLKRLVMKAIGEDSDDAETVRPKTVEIDNSAWFVKHSGPLPTGWKAEFDNNQQAWYFYNGTTTTWIDPRSAPQFPQTDPVAMRAYAEWYANAYAMSYANLQYAQGGEGPVAKEFKREKRRAREYKNINTLIDEASRRIQEATDQDEKRQAEIDLARAQGMLDRLRADDEAKSYPSAFHNVRSPSVPLHGAMMMKGSSVPTPYGMPEQLFAWDMHMRSTMPTEALATVFPPQKR